METNGNTEFSPEIEIAFYEIAEAMNAEDSDDALLTHVSFFANQLKMKKLAQ